MPYASNGHAELIRSDYVNQQLFMCGNDLTRLRDIAHLRTHGAETDSFAGTTRRKKNFASHHSMVLRRIGGPMERLIVVIDNNSDPLKHIESALAAIARTQRERPLQWSQSNCWTGTDVLCRKSKIAAAQKARWSKCRKQQNKAAYVLDCLCRLLANRASRGYRAVICSYP